MGKTSSIFRTPFWIRLFHWEYWSFSAVYIWIWPFWLWYCIRARSFFFFNASNPLIENGGLLNESKKDIHELMPFDLYPKTLHFDQGTPAEAVIQALGKAGMSFPVIGKPDVGGKGRGVRKLVKEGDVAEYARQALMDYHIQTFVPYELEAGIFYCRLPGEERGRITGIVKKEFLSVVGNGRDTVKTLLLQQARGVMYLEDPKVAGDPKLDLIPEKGQSHVVSPYGNHARGSLFLDFSHLADEELNITIDRVAHRVPEFYFGRLDIRYRDWDALKRGEDFSVLEVNGAGAEPTHMYDPRHSIFFAWKEIIRHWSLLCRVSRRNHARGIPYLTFRQGREVFRKNDELSALLDQMPA